jgi:hypothetical protein
VETGAPFALLEELEFEIVVVFVVEELAEDAPFWEEDVPFILLLLLG